MSVMISPSMITHLLRDLLHNPKVVEKLIVVIHEIVDNVMVPVRHLGEPVMGRRRVRFVRAADFIVVLFEEDALPVCPIS